MAENSVVDTVKVIDGEVNPDKFTTPYIILVGSRRPWRIIKAINLLAKYGWRPVASFWQNRVIMERTS
ncbi:MAG: hypothetical protein ACFFCO_12395 [Promethearchaeota archaeon]